MRTGLWAYVSQGNHFQQQNGQTRSWKLRESSSLLFPYLTSQEKGYGATFLKPCWAPGTDLPFCLPSKGLQLQWASLTTTITWACGTGHRPTVTVELHPSQPPPSHHRPTDGWLRATLHYGLGLGLSCKRLERLGMTKGAWRLIRSSNESLIHKSKHFPSINLQPVKGNV